MDDYVNKSYIKKDVFTYYFRVILILKRWKILHFCQWDLHIFILEYV